MGKKSRTKGASYERAVAEKLRSVWPDAKRGLGQSRSARSTAPDVAGTDYWIETKKRAKGGVPVHAAMAQAVEDVTAAKDPRCPVVIHALDRGEDLVTMRLSDWLALMHRVQNIIVTTDDFDRPFAEELRQREPVIPSTP